MPPLKQILLALFSFSVGCTASEPSAIPFELVGGLVYVQVSVNGTAPAPFVLDTGATYSVLPPETAAEQALVTKETLPAAGPGRGGDATMKIAGGVSLRVGNLELKNQQVAVLSVDYITQQSGHPTSGILSVHAFEGLVVQVDYPAGLLRLFNANDFVPAPEDTEIPLTLKDNVPFVQAEVGIPNHDDLPGTFILDSGLVGEILFGNSFQERHPELKTLKTGSICLRRGRRGNDASAGGAASTSAPRQHQRGEPGRGLQHERAGVLDDPSIDGIIGCAVLMRYRVSYDYPHGRLFLARHPHPALRQT
jgi:hypothetical protein